MEMKVVFIQTNKIYTPDRSYLSGAFLSNERLKCSKSYISNGGDKLASFLIYNANLRSQINTIIHFCHSGGGCYSSFIVWGYGVAAFNSTTFGNYHESASYYSFEAVDAYRVRAKFKILISYVEVFVYDYPRSNWSMTIENIPES